MSRPLANSLLYASVWLLVLERLWMGMAFVMHDTVFLLFQRGRVRRRIAALVTSHGAVSGEEAAPQALPPKGA